MAKYKLSQLVKFPKKVKYEHPFKHKECELNDLIDACDKTISVDVEKMANLMWKYRFTSDCCESAARAIADTLPDLIKEVE